jgi:signal transduction histidine kinase
MEIYLRERHINLNKEYAPDIPQVFGVSSEITQVFLNMIMNAVESMPDGGDLFIKIKTVKESLQIDIIDTGKGMSQEELKSVFDPFFTTKQNGSGIGLAVCHKIIEGHGGNIHITSECGKGTTMSLFLPINEKKEL